MQKINLLPKTVSAKQQTAVAWAVVGISLLLMGGGIAAGYLHLASQKADLSAKVEERNTELTRLNGIKTKADETNNSVSKYQPHLTFMSDLDKYNGVRPALYEKTAQYIYRNAMALNMESTNNALAMDLYVSNIRDLAQTFLYLNNNPDFNSVAISGVPVFKVARPVVRQATVNPADIPISEFANQIPGGAGGDQGLAGGFGAPMFAGGGPMMGGSGGMGGPMAGMMGGPMAGGSGMGPGMTAPSDGGAMMGGPMMGGPMAGGSGGMMGGPMAGMMMGGRGGMMGGGNNQEGAIPGIRYDRLPPGAEPLGGIVKVTCELKQPITRPDAGNDIGGGGGGMGGMMGGRGGMMGGMGGMMGGMGGSGGMMGGSAGMVGGGRAGGGGGGNASVAP